MASEFTDAILSVRASRGLQKAAHTERRAIRTEKEKELETLAGLTDRVERAAMSAPRSAPNDDTGMSLVTSLPGPTPEPFLLADPISVLFSRHVVASPEETYDDLENADDKTAFLKSLPLSSLPPLARYMKDLYAQQIQTMAQTIEDEVVVRSRVLPLSWPAPILSHSILTRSPRFV